MQERLIKTPHLWCWYAEQHHSLDVDLKHRQHSDFLNVPPNMELEFAGYATFIQIIQITAAATCFIYLKMLKGRRGGIPRS